MDFFLIETIPCMPARLVTIPYLPLKYRDSTFIPFVPLPLALLVLATVKSLAHFNFFSQIPLVPLPPLFILFLLSHGHEKDATAVGIHSARRGQCRSRVTTHGGHTTPPGGEDSAGLVATPAPSDHDCPWWRCQVLPLCAQ